MSTINKTIYESPKIDVRYVVTEGAIAVSPSFSDDLEWLSDPDPTPAPYDGDLWVNF
jgi:hypothetical protein